MMLEPVSPGTAIDTSLDYEARLAACAADTYFMAYTSLLRQDAWSDKRAKRLEAILTTRKELAGELRAALAKSAALPPAECTALLAGLARAQTTALQALEAEEESIRLDLTTRGAFRRYEDGIRLRLSGIGGPQLSPVAIVLLSAAQFDAGLSAVQRELLQGAVQELTQTGHEATASFSFWPARARLPLPPDLPADFAAGLQEVRLLKQQLVEEMITVLDRNHDDARSAALADLAARQAPAFARLDDLADRLRPRLAPFYAPVAVPATVAPDTLLLQAERAFARKSALQYRVNAAMRELRRHAPDDRIELVQQGASPAIVFTVTQASKLTAAEKDALENLIKAFNGELERRTRILTTDSQNLQKSLREYRDKTLQNPGANLAQLAASLRETLAARENERLYRDYRAAVFQAGLSPEQRRLLLRETLAEIERTRSRDPWAD
ncbi:MAG TPA: hypothetical protein VG734_04000 [Lacunisphaera sp.]|nr:hypothetical protein [Lacunisphaera sp.]